MNEPPRRRAGWTRWAFRIAAALVAIAVALAAAIHAPPVRRYALRRAVATLEERYDLRLRADALHYNLLALRVTLTGLRVAARGADETPFFIAERVTARLPASAVLGPFAIERIDVTGGRLHVVRDASGRSNLPAGGGGAGAPAALEIGVLAAPRLAVEIGDGASGVLLRLPATDVELGGASRVELVDPGHVARGDVSATIHELHGGVAFDGRTFTLAGVSVATDEFEASVTGTLAALVASPRMDLRLVVEADTADLARWGRLDDPPAGAIALDAVIAGPFAAPTAAGTIRAARLEWRGVAASAVRATVRFDDGVVRVERLVQLLDLVLHLAAGRQVHTLTTPAPPRNREEEARKARDRSLKRFAS